MTRHADHPIDAQYLSRRSPRAFGPQILQEAQLRQVLEAARWAPSASNNQPWRAAYGLREDADFARIAAGLNDSNRLWAAKAGALIVWASRRVVTGKDGGDAPNAWASFDAGTAWGFLALQAHSMGLIAHAMGGFDADVLAKNLAMPQDYQIHAVIALGHLGDVNDLPEPLRAREVFNQRQAQSDWAGRGKFV